MKNFVLSIIVVLIIVSCNTKTNKSDEKELTGIKMTAKDSIAAILFTEKCLICHNHVGKVDSTMIAPPFFAVKKRYLKAAKDKEGFVELMRNWVKNPSEEKLLMRGTMDSFGVMPYLAYSEEDITKIVNYVYENEIEKPEWFDAHQASHGNEGRGGTGNGNGNRQGRNE